MADSEDARSRRKQERLGSKELQRCGHWAPLKCCRLCSNQLFALQREHGHLCLCTGTQRASRPQHRDCGLWGRHCLVQTQALRLEPSGKVKPHARQALRHKKAGGRGWGGRVPAGAEAESPCGQPLGVMPRLTELRPPLKGLKHCHPHHGSLLSPLPTAHLKSKVYSSPSSCSLSTEEPIPSSNSQPVKTTSQSPRVTVTPVPRSLPDPPALAGLCA